MIPTTPESDHMIGNRLDRIESELREMRQVLVVLARVDERMANLIVTNVKRDADVAALFVRTAALETSTALTTKSVGNAERGWWIAFTTVLSVASAWLARHF